MGAIILRSELRIYCKFKYLEMKQLNMYSANTSLSFFLKCGILILKKYSGNANLNINNIT